MLLMKLLAGCLLLWRFVKKGRNAPAPAVK